MREIHLVQLAEAYAQSKDLSVSRVGALAANDGKFFTRLATGGTCTLRTAASVVRWFAANWPGHAEWPPGVARPAPTPRERAA